MREEILMNITPQETRVAVIKNELLQELFIERNSNQSIVGNIYQGIVSKVLPGMQAAFVDIGAKKHAFLHANDLLLKTNEQSQLQQTNPYVNISSLTTEGQRLLVQVTQEPLANKGAKLTGQITIPARTLVLLPYSDYIGISKRIQGKQQRDALSHKLKQLTEKLQISCGLILRTAGSDVAEQALIADIQYVQKVWQNILQKIKNCKPPALIHQSLPKPIRFIRDLVWEDVKKVSIDSKETFNEISDYVFDLIPQAQNKIECYFAGEHAIFDLYAIEDEIEKALSRKVDLKSGGYLIIDQTEALTTIDVNTGSFVGCSRLEETITKTNLEAATALARQLRVRNLGGIIIVDFIDMAEEAHRNQVIHTLEQALKNDKNKVRLNGMSELGLVEITRQRIGESLAQVLTQSCPTCQGRGVQKTPQTICYEIFREILRSASRLNAETILVIASGVVIDTLLDEESSRVTDLQKFIRKDIRLQSDSAYRSGQFDVISA